MGTEDSDSDVPELTTLWIMEKQFRGRVVVGVDLREIAGVRTTEGPVMFYTVLWSKLSYFG
jgi:hypothetical protein